MFWGFPDQGLKNTTEFLENLVRQIRVHRPDIVVTVDPERRYILHQDHFVTGRSTRDAIFPFARDHLSFPERLSEGLEPHKVGEVYLWGSQFPDHFVDVTDTFGIKFDALHCHASQIKRPRTELEARARAAHVEAGKNIGVELAESFKRIVLPS